MHAADVIERHLPEDPDGRLHTICFWRDAAHEAATSGDLRLWQRSLRSFETLAAYRSLVANVEVSGDVVAVPGIETTASTFDLLRTPPVLGRVLQPDDERAGAPGVVVIGHDLWRTRFAADPSVVGRALDIGGDPHTIVGVMPAGFRFPSRHDLWLPLRLPEDGAGPRRGASLAVFGRLADRVTRQAAEAEVQALTASLASAAATGTAGPAGSSTNDAAAFDRLRATVLPSWHLTFGFPSARGFRGVSDYYVARVVTLLPLLVACVNVGLLIFARTSTRSSEFAVRTALGASRARILTQVFTESLVLALIATGAGLLLLSWLPGRFFDAMGITLPYWIDPRLSLATVLRGIGLAVISAGVAGVVPALRTTGASIHRTIQRAQARRSGVRFGGLSSGLIVVDVAVAVMAVGFAAGVLGKILEARPNEAYDGIRTGEFLAVTLNVSAGGDVDADRQHVARTQAAIVDRLRAEPGVGAVTFATALPRMDHEQRRIEVEGGLDAVHSGPRRVRIARVAPDFFTQLGRPVIAGRTFDDRDLRPEARTVIVNTTFATNAFGAASPIGRRLRYTERDGTAAGPWLEIVGVVGHLGVHALTPTQDDGVYRALAAGEANPVQIAIQLRSDPAAFAPRARAIARDVDPRAAVASAVPLDAMVEGDWYILGLVVLGGLVVIGVLLSLAASALYAILSFTVASRTREIGIRVALGANPFSVARHVARRAVVQVAVGVLLGLPVAARMYFEFLESVGAGPSLVGSLSLALGQGLVVLLLVSLAACTVPTLRALRISPVEALRGDV
jgi:predicted permease